MAKNIKWKFRLSVEVWATLRTKIQAEGGPKTQKMRGKISVSIIYFMRVFEEIRKKGRKSIHVDCRAAYEFLHLGINPM